MECFISFRTAFEYSDAFFSKLILEMPRLNCYLAKKRETVYVANSCCPNGTQQLKVLEWPRDAAKQYLAQRHARTREVECSLWFHITPVWLLPQGTSAQLGGDGGAGCVTCSLLSHSFFCVPQILYKYYSKPQNAYQRCSL